MKETENILGHKTMQGLKNKQQDLKLSFSGERLALMKYVPFS